MSVARSLFATVDRKSTRHRLLPGPDRALRARLDCSATGGRCRIDGSEIAIEVTHFPDTAKAAGGGMPCAA